MLQIKNLRNFIAIILFIFQHLLTIKSFPIIDESSLQETLIRTVSSADFKLELLPNGNDVNKEDKSNDEPKKSYVSSMFEYWLPESRGILYKTQPVFI
jgi:hypothetical protein